MDIERFKRLSIPKIETGKMTEVVRDVIKESELEIRIHVKRWLKT